MKDIQTRQCFVEMRAQGKTYSEISTHLNVSKQTLINWSKELQIDIANMRAVERDELLNRHKLHSQARIEGFGILLSKLRAELERRDFADVSSEKLVELMIRVSGQIKGEDLVLKQISSPTFVTEKIEWAG